MPENNNLFNGNNNLGNENIGNANKGNENASSVIQGANRQKQQEALAHAEGNRGNIGSRTPKSSASSLGKPGSKSKSSTNTRDASANASARSRSLKDLKTNPASPIYKAKRKALESAMKTGLAAEIGPVASKKLVESDLVQNAIDRKLQSGERLLKNPSPKDVLKDVKNLKDDLSSLKGNKDKKKDLERKSKEASGEFSAELSGKAIKTILIVTPFFAMIVFMVVIVTVLFTDEKTSSMLLGEISSSEGKSEVKKTVSEAQNSVGMGSDDLYGKAATNIPKEYYDRLKSLGNLYSTNIECSGDECFERPEFIYYLKIADIATRYKNKYNVNLDWALITAANLSVDNSTEEIMSDNAGGYSDTQLDDISSTISIDWDYDYKNISGYQYLDSDDSTYDLQILAKNMVKKTTNMSCINSSGNVTQTQSIEDVEDKYLIEGGEKALRCSAGERYTYSSTYTKDMDKFDEFLLEYIDKKIYTKGSGKNNSNNSSNGCVSTNSSYIWPIGSESTTNSNGIEYALGDPYTKTITSRFGSKESFRINGHGAIDIAGVPGAGIVNVVASKSGTVVYPISDAQTGYADNGYYGNKDGGGYGNYVIIQHDDGNYTLYAHLAQNSIRVRAGDVVDQGQAIAKLGHSGSSTGPHLHFEVREGGNSSAYRVDPLGFVDPNNPRPNISVSNSCTSSENKGMADAFVNLALEQKKDSSANGGQKYRDYMQPGIGHYYWCAAFVSWNIYNTEYDGQKLSDIINFKSTWVYQFMNDFYEAGKDNPTSVKQFHYNDNCSTFAGKNGGTDTYVPKKGDLIFFDWNNKFRNMPTSQGIVSHIGIVNYVDNGVIHTIEGNTGGGNGRVGENTYQLNSCSVVGFGSWY